MTRLRILVTTSSLQNTPGRHHPMLERQGFDIVHAMGPLDEGAMLACAGDFDVILWGDDALTETVLPAARPPATAFTATTRSKHCI